MSGKGCYIFNNGDRYEGEFKDGKFHGKGEYYFTASKMTQVRKFYCLID